MAAEFAAPAQPVLFGRFQCQLRSSRPKSIPFQATWGSLTARAVCLLLRKLTIELVRGALFDDRRLPTDSEFYLRSFRTFTKVIRREPCGKHGIASTIECVLPVSVYDSF